MSNATGSFKNSRRSKPVASSAFYPPLSPDLAMTERCAACLELLLAYIETGNDWVELKARSAVGQSTSAQLKSARQRKTDARRRLILQQGPVCCSCPNRIRTA